MPDVMTPAEKYLWSLEEFGPEHTHALHCRTWRGHNWAGACNCALDGDAPTEERASREAAS